MHSYAPVVNPPRCAPRELGSPHRSQPALGALCLRTLEASNAGQRFMTNDLALLPSLTSRGAKPPRASREKRKQNSGGKHKARQGFVSAGDVASHPLTKLSAVKLACPHASGAYLRTFSAKAIPAQDLSGRTRSRHLLAQCRDSLPRGGRGVRAGGKVHGFRARSPACRDWRG